MDLDIYKMSVLLSFFKMYLTFTICFYNSNLTIASHAHLYLSVGVPLGSRTGPRCKTVFNDCFTLYKYILITKYTIDDTANNGIGASVKPKSSALCSVKITGNFKRCYLTV